MLRVFCLLAIAMGVASWFDLETLVNTAFLLGFSSLFAVILMPLLEGHRFSRLEWICLAILLLFLCLPFLGSY